MKSLRCTRLTRPPRSARPSRCPLVTLRSRVPRRPSRSREEVRVEMLVDLEEAEEAALRPLFSTEEPALPRRTKLRALEILLNLYELRGRLLGVDPSWLIHQPLPGRSLSLGELCGQILASAPTH